MRTFTHKVGSSSYTVKVRKSKQTKKKKKTRREKKQADVCVGCSAARKSLPFRSRLRTGKTQALPRKAKTNKQTNKTKQTSNCTSHTENTVTTSVPHCSTHTHAHKTNQKQNLTLVVRYYLVTDFSFLISVSHALLRIIGGSYMLFDSDTLTPCVCVCVCVDERACAAAG